MTTNLELRDSDLDTRRYILEPTTASARLACRSAATWTFITAGDRIRALTARHPIKPISASCRSAWQPNLGRRSTYRCGNSVQTTGTTSQFIFRYLDGAFVQGISTLLLLHKNLLLLCCGTFSRSKLQLSQPAYGRHRTGCRY